VSFVVSDSFGQTLRQYRITVTKRSAGPANSWVLNGNSGPLELPFGECQLNATASLCAPFVRQFSVERPETLVPVALTRLGGSQISGEGTPLHEPVEGKVIGAGTSPGHRLWVRIYSVLGMFTAEASVERDGIFTLESVPNGAYLIVVFRGTQILTQGTIAPVDGSGRDRTILLNAARRGE
jgi:hypothetical protein